jgi:hypothetical protein
LPGGESFSLFATNSTTSTAGMPLALPGWRRLCVTPTDPMIRAVDREQDREGGKSSRKVCRQLVTPKGSTSNTFRTAKELRTAQWTYIPHAHTIPFRSAKLIRLCVVPEIKREMPLSVNLNPAT